MLRLDMILLYMLLTEDKISDSLKEKKKEVAMFDEDDNTGPAILVSFLVGGIVGAGLALLFAPQAGKKTRRQLAELADDVKDYAADYTKKLKDKIA